MIAQQLTTIHLFRSTVKQFRKLRHSCDEVHEQAQRLEHVISKSMEERMARMLEDPRTDPYGDPIPDRNGEIPDIETILLTQLPDRQTAVIKRITGQEPEVLRYLADQGLILSVQVQVISKAPFHGPVSISLVGRPEPILAFARDLTDTIRVQPGLISS